MLNFLGFSNLKQKNFNYVIVKIKIYVQTLMWLQSEDRNAYFFKVCMTTPCAHGTQ